MKESIEYLSFIFILYFSMIIPNRSNNNILKSQVNVWLSNHIMGIHDLRMNYKLFIFIIIFLFLFFCLCYGFVIFELSNNYQKISSGSCYSYTYIDTFSFIIILILIFLYFIIHDLIFVSYVFLILLCISWQYSESVA